MKFTGRRPNQPRAAARGHQQDDTPRLQAHADLMAQLGVVTRGGQVVPCLGHRDTWTAADAATQKAAARACLDCPALDACAAYVTAHPEPTGTWAGLTEYQRAKQQRNRN